MKVVKIETDGSIKLPKEMLRLFPTESELAVWTEGDMMFETVATAQAVSNSRTGSGERTAA
jgi:hypothetical protein